MSDAKNPSNRGLYTVKQFKKCKTKNDLPMNCSQIAGVAKETSVTRTYLTKKL